MLSSDWSVSLCASCFECCFGDDSGGDVMKQLTAGWFILPPQSRRSPSNKACFSIKSNPDELFGLRLCCWLALCNPGRLFIKGIFSKPPPSTEHSPFSQPCTASWHAAAAALHWGASGSGRLPAAEIHKEERERGSPSLQLSHSLSLPFPVCLVFFL